MVGYDDAESNYSVILNWLSERYTIEFIGLWEQLHNPDFKRPEFDEFKKQAGLNSFVLTPQEWIEKTNAIGIIVKPGQHGNIFAHADIAFEFASWLSPVFKLYLTQEFNRLKGGE